MDCQAVVVHAFNPRTPEADAGGFLSSRPAWSTERVPGQPGIHRETLSETSTEKKKKEYDAATRINELSLHIIKLMS